MAFEIVKAGFIYRQSSVLKRWKRSHTVLYQDGYMRHFDDEDRPVAEEVAHMRECLSVQTGTEVTGVTPPSGCSEDCLLKVVFHSKTWNLCTETTDDKKAWQISLEQAQNMCQPTPVTLPVSPVSQGQMVPGQSALYPGQGYFVGQPPTYVAQNTSGQTIVVHHEQRPAYRTGSLMFMPLLWW